MVTDTDTTEIEALPDPIECPALCGAFYWSAQSELAANRNHLRRVLQTRIRHLCP